MSARTQRRRIGLLAGLLALACVVAVGCGSSNPKRSQSTAARRTGATASISNTDACATRLHEISGSLLLFYAVHHELPDNLDQLLGVDQFNTVDDFVCPVSKLPYIYDPSGKPAPDGSGRIVLYDATPAHSKMRWAVSVIAPQGSGPLVTKVIAVPESYFAPRGIGGVSR